jgi:hypothetical protein
MLLESAKMGEIIFVDLVEISSDLKEGLSLTKADHKTQDMN